MKFIGQYIQDFIARFRSDVYLENISSGTIASGGSLGLDSNNKVVKASASAAPDADATTKGIVELATTAETTTGTDATRAVTPDGLKDGYQGSTNVTTLGSITTGVWRGTAIDQAYLTGQSGTNTGDQTSVSGNAGTATALETARNIAGVSFDGTADISLNNNAITNGAGYTTNTGDITSVQFTSSVGSHTESSGNAAFILAGAAPLTFTNVNETFTVSASNASTSAKGVASFSSDNFAASSGAISIKSGGVDLTDEVTGTLPVGNGGTGATTLTSNSILTGNGTSAVQAEAGLTYDSEVLSVGDDDDGIAQIRRTPHSDDTGGALYIRGGDAPTSGATDKDGGILRLYGGRGTGAGSGGAVSIATSKAESSGTSFHSSDVVATFRSDGKTLLTGNLIFEGPVVDGNDTEFSITEQTANRTITVPDATGTMCVSGADGSNIVVLGSGTGFVSSPAAQTWHFGNSLYGFNHFNWKSVTAGMVSDSSTFTLSEDYNGVGQFVPATLSKVVARVSCRPATTSNETFKVTICSADRDAGGTNTTWTALASATNETSIGVWEGCDATYTGSIATSKILAIGVGIDESSVSTGNVRFNWQLVGYLT